MGRKDRLEGAWKEARVDKKGAALDEPLLLLIAFHLSSLEVDAEDEVNDAR
jgi:hypothetical protein